MKISSASNGVLHFSAGIPAALGYLKIPGSLALHATESFADICYQKYETKDYSFWFSAYTAKEDHQFHIYREGPMIGFKLLLKQDLRYRCETGELYLKQGQFCFAQIPRLDSLFSIVKGGEYAVFDMTLDVGFIKSLRLGIPLLDAFMEKASADDRSFLLDTAAQSNILLLDAIAALLKYPADRTAAAVVVRELMAVSAQWEGGDLPQYKIERMYRARGIILSDITRHITNPNLAKMVGTNARDLKVEFVKVFSIPPGQYLQYERIKLVKQLLKEQPGMSIDSIASLAGFKNSAALDPVFKHHEGLSPSSWRGRLGNSK